MKFSCVIHFSRKNPVAAQVIFYGYVPGRRDSVLAGYTKKYFILTIFPHFSKTESLFRFLKKLSHVPGNGASLHCREQGVSAGIGQVFLLFGREPEIHILFLVIF